MELENHDHVALIRLRGGKANAMTRDFLTGLIALLDRAEAGDARAIVLAGYEKYFSAGLALPMLYALDRPAMGDFIDLFSTAMLRAFRARCPVVAAINGHAIAGGCVLALMADVRLMAEGTARIGLNEVQLGIGLPSVVIESLRMSVPPASIVPIALEGTLFLPNEALRLGLVDETAPAEELEGRALARAKKLASAPLTGTSQVKAALRAPAIAAIEARGNEERERWLDSWFSPEGRRLIDETVARLSKK